VAQERRLGYAFLAPLTLLLLGLAVFPGLYAYYLSALDATLETFRSPRFTGLTNYVRILTDREFYDAIGFSLRYTVVVVTLEVVLGLALAIALNRELRGKRILISLLLLPLMVSPALLGIMFRLMLNEFIGTVSYYLRASGFPANLLAPPYVPYTLMVVDVIQWTPFTFLILYAGLRSIPDEPVEAAVVDGAGGWQILRFVILPLLQPLLLTAGFLRGIDAFKTFDTIQVLTAGGPGSLTTTASIYVYKMAFLAGHLGRANAAVVLLLFLLSIPMSQAIRHILRRTP